MEILAATVSNLKCSIAQSIEEDMLVQNYGISLCKDNIRSCISSKLNLIFLENIKYLGLNKNQLLGIKSGDYKVCLNKKVKNC